MERQCVTSVGPAINIKTTLERINIKTIPNISKPLEV